MEICKDTDIPCIDIVYSGDKVICSYNENDCPIYWSIKEYYIPFEIEMIYCCIFINKFNELDIRLDGELLPFYTRDITIENKEKIYNIKICALYCIFSLIEYGRTLNLITRNIILKYGKNKIPTSDFNNFNLFLSNNSLRKVKIFSIKDYELKCKQLEYHYIIEEGLT